MPDNGRVIQGSSENAMRRRIEILPVLLLATGCIEGLPDEPPADTSSSAEPLIGGTISYDDDGAAALLTSGGSVYCSGTLVSPSVVLTAAHCVDGTTAEPPATVFFGPDIDGEGPRMGATSSWYHPNWDGEPGQYDIGLVLLDRPVAPEAVVPLNTSPATDHVGEECRIIGYGVNVRGTDEGVGIRRTATELIRQTQSDVFTTGSTETSICFGDSGGPVLLDIDGIEYVAGVSSYTRGENCDPPQGCTRVDLYVDSYIRPWIQEHDSACGEDGLCARTGCVDDPDCAPCGPDGTCTDECPLPDPDCPTSGLGEICQADTQCASGLCVFWTGDTHSKFCSRECDLGADDCPDGMLCKTVMPFGDICYFEEPPAGVVGDRCDEPTDCGSYICDQGECVIECDLGAGQLCPADFECGSQNGVDYYCHGIGGDEGGGCCAAAGSRGASGPTTGHFAVLALALLGLLGARRRSRIQPRKWRVFSLLDRSRPG